jgi:hypothetical protein
MQQASVGELQVFSKHIFQIIDAFDIQKTQTEEKETQRCYKNNKTK